MNEKKQKKKKNSKKAKWAILIIVGLIVIAIGSLVTALAIWFDGMRESPDFKERSGEYSMPPKPPLSENSNDESEIPDDINPDGDVKIPIYKVGPKNKNIRNILLLGKDDGRSDTMIMASYNKKTGNVALTSFMRDSLVPIEIRDNYWNRLNATYAYGGAPLTINTLNNVYDLDLQYYITIDFNGFTNLINTLGGVNINVTEVEANHLNWKYNMHISAGNTTLNGEEALIFSRIRKGVGDDYARTERQRRLLTAIINMIYENKSVSDVITLMNEAKNFVRTNLSLSEITSLIKDFMSKDDINVDSYRIPADDTFQSARYNSMSILDIDFDKNKDIIRQNIYGN